MGFVVVSCRIGFAFLRLGIRVAVLYCGLALCFVWLRLCFCHVPTQSMFLCIVVNCLSDEVGTLPLRWVGLNTRSVCGLRRR